MARSKALVPLLSGLAPSRLVLAALALGAGSLSACGGVSSAPLAPYDAYATSPGAAPSTGAADPALALCAPGCAACTVASEAATSLAIANGTVYFSAHDATGVGGEIRPLTIPVDTGGADGVVRSVSTHGGNVTTLDAGLRAPLVLGVDDQVYVGATDEANMNGPVVYDLPTVGWNQRPGGFAFATSAPLVGHKVYAFVDGAVQETDLDSGAQRTVLDAPATGSLHVVALAADAAHVYALLDTGAIVTSPVGLALSRTLVPAGSVDPGASLAVDGASVFWFSGRGGQPGSGAIGRVDDDGSNRTLATGLDAPTPIGFDAGHVYFANRAGAGAARAPKAPGAADPGHAASPVFSGAVIPLGAAVDADAAYFATDTAIVACSCPG
jgi:hypothetical protein